MVFKYQVMLVKRSSDLLRVTLTHLQVVASEIVNDTPVAKLVTTCMQKTHQVHHLSAFVRHLKQQCCCLGTWYFEPSSLGLCTAQHPHNAARQTYKGKGGAGHMVLDQSISHVHTCRFHCYCSPKRKDRTAGLSFLGPEPSHLNIACLEPSRTVFGGV
jgi:hypothetical protein